jgi:hypothetical protein
MSAYIDLAREKSKTIRQRVGREGSFQMRFFVDNVPWPVPDEEFELFAKDNNALELPGKDLILTIGDGLARGIAAESHILFVTVSRAKALLLKPRRYHWQLLNRTRWQTWLNGFLLAHIGNFSAGDSNDMDINMNFGDIIINVNLTIIETGVPVSHSADSDQWSADTTSFSVDEN